MTRPTARGTGLVVTSVALLAAGLAGGWPLPRALGAAGLLAVLGAVLAGARRVRVSVAREVYPDRVGRGRPAFAQLRVRNAGTRRQSAFTAGDRVGAGTHEVRVRALAPGTESVLHYELPTGTRGRHQVGPLTLERRDPLGLGRAGITTGDTATLWVHPKVRPVLLPVGGHPRHHHEGVTTELSPHGSHDLRDVREYVPGDEVRHLHWKATARTGRLMVRDFVDPEQPRFTVVLDTRCPPGPLFEEAVDVAASLLAAAATAGHRCRLVTPCGVDVATLSGSPAVRRLLDELCVLTGGATPDSRLLPESRERGGILTVVAAGPLDLAPVAAVRSRYASTVAVILGASAPPAGATRVLLAPDAVSALRRWTEVVAS
ncbi:MULTISPECIES: DUF58 domain-containing protein [unclassified Amycolatopsis]|uniref:DUF58 domain-containing protein n=1 Tax=unclassified Amycolatopsis TaxID=2618356 RepID=UPI002E238843|nr:MULTISPECIES: DUF58 domain-containing protein [unclassified Amycolatopsis]